MKLMSDETRAMFKEILNGLPELVMTAEFNYMGDIYFFKKNPHGVWFFKNDDSTTGNYWFV